MNILIKKVIDYQQNRLEFVFEEILDELKELINIHTKKISKKYQEELRQELLMGIFECLNNFKVIYKTDFENLSIERLIEEYQIIEADRYYKSFISKYKINELILKTMDKSILINYINEYYLFCNENQFRKFIDTTFRNKRALFCRKNKIHEDDNIISFNLPIIDDIELIDIIPDNYNKKNKEVIDRSLLSDKDNQFIDAFSDGNYILKEKEVARKLGVTQQAVSSMLKRIRQRYTNNLNKKDI